MAAHPSRPPTPASPNVQPEAPTRAERLRDAAAAPAPAPPGSWRRQNAGAARRPLGAAHHQAAGRRQTCGPGAALVQTSPTAPSAWTPSGGGHLTKTATSGWQGSRIVQLERANHTVGEAGRRSNAARACRRAARCGTAGRAVQAARQGRGGQRRRRRQDTRQHRAAGETRTRMHGGDVVLAAGQRVQGDAVRGPNRGIANREAPAAQARAVGKGALPAGGPGSAPAASCSGVWGLSILGTWYLLSR